MFSDLITPPSHFGVLELLLAAVQTRILLGHGRISSSSRLRRHHHALLFLHPFTDDGNSVTRLGQEYNDSALTDPDLVAHLVVSYTARQSSAASTLGFSSHWWSRECVICAQLKVHSLCIVRMGLRVLHPSLSRMWT